MYLGMCLQVKLENESRAGLYSMKKFYALLFSSKTVFQIFL